MPENHIVVNPEYSEIVFNNNYYDPKIESEWKEYRLKWVNNPKQRKVESFPLHLDIELTNYCNLKCPMCPRTQMLKRGMKIQNKFMKLDTFKKIINQAENKSLYAINLNASGEPLFNKDLASMIEYAREKGVIDIMFHTNGTNLDKRLSERLIDSGLNKLIVSFDSPIKEHYEKIRLGASFDSVVENVKQFIQIKNRKNKQIPHVRINMVVMKENYHEKESMVDFWKNDVDSIGFLQYVNFFGLDDENRSVNEEKSVYNDKFVCERLWQRLAITELGEIKLCHLDDSGKIVLGHIDTDNISELWTGKAVNRYREKHLQGNIKNINLCAECGLPVL